MSGVTESRRGEIAQRLGDGRILIGSVVIEGDEEGSNGEAVDEWVIIYQEKQ